MCGRYSLTLAFEDVISLFNIFIDELSADTFPPRYNVAPTNIMPVIINEEGQKRIKPMQWGLIPYWAKDKSISSKLINARLETLAEKPAFKGALARRRCLVPADGYYEWQKTSNKKNPYRIIVSDRKVFAFAGLWDEWRSPNGDPILSFTIITTAPAAAVSQIHDRMPLILPKELEDRWIGGAASDQDRADFLNHIAPETELKAYPVSPLVNSPKNDFPACITQI